jgi:hypothetical protein
MSACVETEQRLGRSSLISTGTVSNVKCRSVALYICPFKKEYWVSLIRGSFAVVSLICGKKKIKKIDVTSRAFLGAFAKL